MSGAAKAVGALYVGVISWGAAETHGALQIALVAVAACFAYGFTKATGK